MDNPHPARYPRLHRSTWVVGILVLFLGLVIVLPGLGVTYPLGVTLNGEAVVYEHGWPYTFLTRNTVRSGRPLLGIPWMSCDAWQVWQAESGSAFSPGYLVLDALILAACVVVAAAVWEWRLRRSRILQISLAGLLALITLVALPLGWFTYHRTEEQRESEHVMALEDQLGGSFGSVIVPDYTMPLWLEKLVGWEILPKIKFNRVKTVMLRPLGSDASARLAEALPHLKSLQKLETLMLEVPTAIEDQYFGAIADLSQLREVKLSGKKSQLAFDLHLAEQVAQLQQLTHLEISFENGVAEDARQLLRERMPHCTTEYFSDD